MAWVGFVSASLLRFRAGAAFGDGDGDGGSAARPRGGVVGVGGGIDCEAVEESRQNRQAVPTSSQPASQPDDFWFWYWYCARMDVEMADERMGWAGLDSGDGEAGGGTGAGYGAGLLTRYLRRAVPTPRRPHRACSRYLWAQSTRRRHANLAQCQGEAKRNPQRRRCLKRCWCPENGPALVASKRNCATLARGGSPKETGARGVFLVL